MLAWGVRAEGAKGRQSRTGVEGRWNDGVTWPVQQILCLEIRANGGRVHGGQVHGLQADGPAATRLSGEIGVIWTMKGDCGDIHLKLLGKKERSSHFIQLLDMRDTATKKHVSRGEKTQESGRGRG